MTKVAIEQGLRPFQEALRNAGYVVVEVTEPSEIDSLAPHAVVVSGMDSDFMGIQDAREAPVITAAGRTPEEVVDEVRRSLGPRE
ncbi:MAG TPA: YkuS family protein [Firmicutes bacterium]|nr:YkuS family protein [Candidatus Fermentithermobacillaceae bacterium]